MRVRTLGGFLLMQTQLSLLERDILGQAATTDATTPATFPVGQARVLHKTDTGDDST